MTIHRFIVDSRCIRPEDGLVKIDNPKQVRQLRKVLRLSVGSRLDVLDDSGALFRCVVEDLTSESALCTIVEVAPTGETSPRGGELVPSVRVFLPLIQNARFDFALQKLTELGVEEIVPFSSLRSRVKVENGAGESGDWERRSRRWLSIVREASEQCERIRTPRVVPPVDFATALSMLRKTEGQSTSGETAHFIAVARSEAPHLIQLLSPDRVADRIGVAEGESDTSRRSGSGDSGRATGASRVVSDISIFIGPEGGFAQAEIEAALAAGCRECSLGGGILRSETACIVAAFTALSIGEFL